jgi:hypothetical protein
MNRPAAPARGKRPLLVVMLILFAAPLAAAFWLYYGSSWRPSVRTNHGELIEPAVALGESAPVALTGKWSLVVIGTGESGCDAECRSALAYARQTWLSLAQLSPRVRRILLAGSGCCDSAYLLREHAGLVAVPAAGPEAAPLLRAFPEPHHGEIFIVDPLGNLMMRYDVRQDPKGLRLDLKKLLELSHIG